MSGQTQWSSNFPRKSLDIDCPSDTKSVHHHESSLLSQNESGNKSQQSSFRNSRTKPNSIPIIDPDTGTQITILDSSKYRSQNLCQNEVNNLQIQAIKVINSITDQETKELPQSLNILKLDRKGPPKAFKSSTPADNVTHESDLVSGVSEVTHTPGGTRHNPLARLGSAKSGLSRMARISGSRNRENEILAQKINLRLVNLERDSADVLKGLGKVKNMVEGLLQEARTTVEKFGRMDDKLSGYPTASQVLLEVGDEITLLTASLSLWQNTMLDSQELDRKSNDSSEYLITPSNKMNEKQICGRERTEIESLKDVLVESESRLHGGNLIPIMDILNDKEAKPSSFLFNKRSFNGENSKTSIDTDHVKDIVNVLNETDRVLDEKSIKSKNEKPETFYYMENFLLYENKTCANNKYLAKEEQSENVITENKEEDGKAAINSGRGSLVFNGQDEIEKKKHTKINEKLKDIEKAESIVLSPEGKLNLRLEKLDVKLEIQNLRSSPLKSHSQILKDVPIENLKNKSEKLSTSNTEISDYIANVMDSLRKLPTFDKDQLTKSSRLAINVPPQNTEISGCIGGNSLSHAANEIKNLIKSEEKTTPESPAQRKTVDPTEPINALPLLNFTPSPWIPPAVSPQDPGSPIPSILLHKAKSKVSDWLENKCQDVNVTSPYHDASSVKSFRAKLGSNSTLQSKDNTFPSRESFKAETFPSSDEEAFKIPSLPHLDTLKILDSDGTFLYFMSMVENPGKFYIHPVQTDTASLDKIHAELHRHSLFTPKECLVLPETVWALCNEFENKWYRVQIETRSSTTVSVRYIDYGSSQERIMVDSLRHLPGTWVSQLPALAVQCHLAGCSPKGKSWNPKATEQLEKMLCYKKQHRGVVVGEEDGSTGVVLLTEDNIVINQKMVECRIKTALETKFRQKNA